MSDTDTVAVRYEVLTLERCEGAGKLIALADVLLATHDVEIILSGCQIRLTPDNRYLAQGPQWRHPRTGQWLPSILQPPPMPTALGAEIIAAMEAPP